LLGRYKLYWYNTKHIRDSEDRRISQATITVRRAIAFRIIVDLRQDNLDDGHYEAYEYSGRLRVFESQIHWIMQGKNHNEIFYAIFDRRLGKGIEALPGLFLLTANDRYRKPMSSRCLLCREGFTEQEIGTLRGGKDFLGVRA
jgi:hypothetical protein